ncbi:NAD(P)/FAD-dependent oxidoreductase [Lentzea guizhouensis]|uniref:NAD(P)/FAD-dependent oxidoreductase n=1 Tax=Lentzea guizhouensis TaxID=1586287 RepID=UPI000AE52C52
MAGNTHVVVVGGGYAGVMAANRLTLREDVAVTLVNPRPEFVHRVRLHQLVGGSDDAVVAYRDVLAQGVRLVVDAAEVINAAERTVTLAGGSPLGYDYLVYAVGSGNAEPDVPGAAEFAHPIATLEAARRLRSVLDDAAVTAPVTVVGAGPTGIETAAELAEPGRRVTLVCGGVLGPYLHARGRRSVARRLAALGVTVVEGHAAKVVAVGRDAVRLADVVSCPVRSPSGQPVSAFPTSPPAAAQHRHRGPSAHRRDADERGRRARPRPGRRGAVRPAAADELPQRDPAGRAGRRHRAQPARG